ncbi:LysR family transcriptional regulator [Chondromyces crocatus]|uniref:HTH lysR-type domain-containing protein n=1 Tax=Chondromyces crocatus TaxID=52 RepID=A0A0K1EI19_CHOCO|nr:LysR family transcriptional regulator [Chondromyces crocatus]AKT40516.1 uncharacterized protein CMC5_046710 [Chondromyces crocatus]
MLHPSEQSEAPLLEEIATFLRVAEAGSLTLAARQLGVPKSTVSRRIARLEEKLGARLLHRTTRKLGLTEVGADYRHRAATAIAQLDEATEVIRAQREQPCGHLRVTAPYDSWLSPFPDLCAEFARLHPRCTLEVVLTDRTLDLVADGIDLAVRGAMTLPDSTLVARRLWGVPIRLYATPRYLEERRIPASPEALAEHDLILNRALHGRGSLRLIGPAGEERQVPVRAAVAVNGFVFVHRVTLAHAGIGLMPSMNAEADVDAGRLVEVLPTWTTGMANMFVVHPGGRLLSAKVRAFQDLLLERMGEKACPRNREERLAHEAARRELEGAFAGRPEEGRDEPRDAATRRKKSVVEASEHGTTREPRKTGSVRGADESRKGSVRGADKSRAGVPARRERAETRTRSSHATQAGRAR